MRAFRKRINSIEIRKYNNSNFEIIKWKENTKYGKKQEYLDNGYAYSFSGDFLRKDGDSIQIEMFDSKEFCYVIAMIEYKSDSWDLRSVGSRILDLTEEELINFWTVYKFANEKLNK